MDRHRVSHGAGCRAHACSREQHLLRYTYVLMLATTLQALSMTSRASSSEPGNDACRANAHCQELNCWNDGVD